MTRHEQVAGFMAVTYGQLTGKAGVRLATLGPGANDLVTAAAYAQLGGMPMLMITGQKRNYKARYSNTVLLDNALATMGAGLPSAMAARLVHPDRQVMTICRDGGFMTNSRAFKARSLATSATSSVRVNQEQTQN